MSSLRQDLDSILDRAETAALALDGPELIAAVTSLADSQSRLAGLEETDPTRRHLQRRLFRLRGLCGGLCDVLGQALGIEEKYDAHGEKVGRPSRSSRRGYV